MFDHMKIYRGFKVFGSAMLNLIEQFHGNWSFRERAIVKPGNCPACLANVFEIGEIQELEQLQRMAVICIAQKINDCV